MSAQCEVVVLCHLTDFSQNYQGGASTLLQQKQGESFRLSRAGERHFLKLGLSIWAKSEPHSDCFYECHAIKYVLLCRL